MSSSFSPRRRTWHWATNQARRVRWSGDSGGNRAKSASPLNGYRLPPRKNPTPTGLNRISLGETQLCREREHAIVRGKNDVIEAVDLVAAEVHRAREAAQARRALEQRHPGAQLGQPKRQGRAEDPPADDGDRRRLVSPGHGQRTGAGCPAMSRSTTSYSSRPESGEIGGG